MTMRNTLLTAGILAACALAASAGPAHAESLDVKTGLWEISAAGPAMKMPEIPADTLAKLSPEQRAMVQQRMAAAAAGGGAQKICVTQEMLDKGMKDNDGGHCTRTLLSSSAHQMVFHMECTGRHKATGTTTVTATDRTSMSMAVDLTVEDNGQQMPIKHTMSGHWLADDCGNVKPSQPQ